MDVMDEELLNFWRKLNENNVKYIMVGGLAARFHGYNRATDDLDLWLEDTLENRRNLRKAFVALDYGDFASLETMQFVPGWTSFYAAGLVLDIMTEMKGLEDIPFKDCLSVALIENLDGILVPFLHINHLIANKKVVNRPKDQLDVIYLEKIKALREQGFGHD